MALASLLALSACVSPGMKLNVNPKTETTTQMGGLNITLRPLTHDYLVKQQPLEIDPTAAELLLTDRVPAYQIGPQDSLLVTVWDHPEITLPLGQFRQDSSSGILVDEKGQIFFPHVGSFKVEGMTASQLREALTVRLSKVLQNPQIDVKVLAFRSQKIYVGGEVKNPAVYNVTDVPFTLSEAINRAGGFNLPTADDSRLILTRGNKSWRLNFPGLMASGNRIGQILLKDGDSLQVPSNMENPIYMMGEITRPGSLPMIHGSLTLAQAINHSGGIMTGSADARSIYVIRQTSTNHAVDVFHLDALNPTAMILADQFQLNARDIVFVDAGTLVRFSRVMDKILPTVSGLASTAMAVQQSRYLVSSSK